MAEEDSGRVAQTASLPVADTVADQTHGPPALARGAVLGGLTILELLGAGGMGEVYAAYDPTLDRKVAVKVLRGGGEGSGQGEARLLREAQAMARISHPNVVAVHQVGVVDGRVWVAMEHVEGTTLRDWLSVARPWPLVVELFGRAGRGLEAAHAAGLVHRDFKPENVLVGRDGRVRVTDFGLVTPSRGDAPDGANPDLDAGAAVLTTLSLTRTGAVLGTPAYMAPEQLRGDPVDARADQFAFCVALHEALYGQRPFAGKSLTELAANVQAGAIVEPSRSAAAPAWLRRAVLHGLATDPERRHASMSALLAALEADPGRRRRRALVGGVALAALAVGVAGSAALLRAPPPCGNAAARLSGVWDATRRARVQQAFAAADPKGGAARFSAVAAALDRWAGSWTRMHQDSCRATHVDHRQSGALLDLRTRCLDRRLGDLTALVDVITAAADADAVDQAVVAALGLSPLRECADAEALAAVLPPPADPVRRALVDSETAELARTRALRQAGRGAEVLSRAIVHVARARVANHPPLLTAALLELSEAQTDAGYVTAGEVTVRELIRVAAQARDDRMVAASWATLLQVLAGFEERPADALALFPAAEAAVLRAGSPPDLRGRLLSMEAATLERLGRTDEALADLEQVRTLIAADAGLDEQTRRRRLADLIGNRANTQYLTGDVDGAIASDREAIAGYTATLGADHPKVAIARKNLGTMLRAQGRYDEALVEYRAAAAILAARLGDHPRVASVLDSTASCLLDAGRYAEALPLAEQVLGSYRAKLPPGDPDIAGALLNRALALENVGRRDEARADYDEAVRMLEAHGGRPLNLPIAIYDRAELLADQGKWREAIVDYGRAVPLFEQTFGPQSPYLISVLNGFGRCLIELGEPRQAIPLLERAIGLTSPGREDSNLAGARFQLGRAYVAIGDRRRGLALAAQARAELAALGPAGANDLAGVDAWLGANRAGPR